MTSIHIRPRFTQTLSLTPNEIIERVQDRLDSEGATCIGACYPTFIELRILPKDQHFWSPQLMLNFENAVEGTKIEGVYGPAKNVWSLFWLMYLFLGLATMWILIHSGVRWSLGMDMPMLWGLAVTGVGLVAVYMFAQTGQKIGAEQMFTLHHFWEEAVGDRVHIH